MRFESFLSEHESTAEAAAEVVRAARERVGGADLAFVFFTGHHAPEAEALVEQLWLELDPQVIVGCSGEGVIGVDREVERAPGLSLLVGQAPGVRAHPFHVPLDDWRALLSDPAALAERAGHGPETRAVLAFGDPFTTPLNQLLPAADDALPHAPLIGGMASSGQRRGDNVLVRNDQTFTDGLVGVSLSGAIEVESVVSQGCRPVGRTMVITKAHDNVIEQLGGRPALTVLREMVNDELTDEERELLAHGLLVGRAISEYRDRFGRGDFLVRNLMGIDQPSGAMSVADYVKVGQTVQFHVRDARTADEDLSALLALERAAHAGAGSAAGGLLFSCNGRGTRLFDAPCHDVRCARAAMPDTPFAGFFAAGELGPVGGKNFVHGHTASFALFRERRE